MIRHCIQSWELNLATGYTEHLREVLTRLQDQLKEEQKHMAGINFVVSMFFSITIVFYVPLARYSACIPAAGEVQYSQKEFYG